MDIKHRFTIDKWGGLVFSANTDIKDLGLDNCFVVKGEKSLWVFPFNILLKYITEYTFDGKFRSWVNGEFDKFIAQNKENFFILYGKVINQTYHYCCQNKMHFITEGRPCYNCQFKALKNTIFKWNKNKCKYIKPLYCDTQYRTCRTLLFQYLCPDIDTENNNRNTLTARGQKANITRKLSKTKCLNCIYNNFCKEKAQRAERNCCLSRKMINRRMRKQAGLRYGSFKELADLMKYSGLKHGQGKNSYEVIVPINNELIIIKRKDDYTFSIKKISEMKQEFAKKTINTINSEYKAKVFMFLMCNLVASRIFKCDNVNQTCWELGWGERKRGYIYVREYNFNSYSDVIKKFGRYGQALVEKRIKNFVRFVPFVSLF